MSENGLIDKPVVRASFANLTQEISLVKLTALLLFEETVTKTEEKMNAVEKDLKFLNYSTAPIDSRYLKYESRNQHMFITECPEGDNKCEFSLSQTEEGFCLSLIHI